MRSTAKKFTTIVSVILMVLACNNASSQENKKAEVYRLLIQADIMQDLDLSFTYKSQSKNSCATTGRPHLDSFTTLDKNKDHDWTLSASPSLSLTVWITSAHSNVTTMVAPVGYAKNGWGEQHVAGGREMKSGLHHSLRVRNLHLDNFVDTGKSSCIDLSA